MFLALLIPKAESDMCKILVPGTVLVADMATLDSSGNLCAYFEGNIHDRVNLRRFEDKAICAAGRLIHRYPTIAKGRFPLRDMVVVGRITEKYEVTLNSPDEIADWEKGYPSKERHFLLVVWDDVEPEIMGPFPSEEARDEKARDLRHKEGPDHGIYPLSVTEEGMPLVGAYAGGDLDSEKDVA